MAKLAFLFLATLITSSPVLVFDRTITSVPPGWTSIGPASINDTLSVTLYMYQRNLDEFNRVFELVSNPVSSQYQNFKTKAEIEALISPLASDVALVDQWLASVHVSRITHLGDALKFTASVGQLEVLFSAKFQTFYHAATNKKLTAHVGPAYIPAHIRDIVELVYGLSAFPVGVKGRLGHKTKANVNAAYKIVAQSWQALYGVPASWKPTSQLTSQGVIQFSGETYSPEGVTGYSTNILPIVGPTKNTTVGPETDAPADEAQLDVEAQAACGTGATQWFWLEDPSKWMLSFSTEFFAHADPLPLSISISYAWSELDQCGEAVTPYDCNTFGVKSEGLVSRTNSEFQKIGARGTSIMVASGDSGVYGRTDEGCIGKKFRPDFPACSPFVTSVGATYNLKPSYLPSGGSTPAVCAGACVSGGDEVAVSVKDCAYASGGGFSNFAPRPNWQSNAVMQYFNSGVQLPPVSFYNASNRGFPDVAAQGFNILVFTDESNVELVSGTSAASPAFSGIISLLNDVSLAKTGKPLGFLNPLLYQMQASNPQAFHDITQGDNKCTEQGCSPWCQGFSAYKGWDPVTGLGTPNFGEMKTTLESFLELKAARAFS